MSEPAATGGELVWNGKAAAPAVAVPLRLSDEVRHGLESLAARVRLPRDQVLELILCGRLAQIGEA